MGFSKAEHTLVPGPNAPSLPAASVPSSKGAWLPLCLVVA